ncbi:MAG: DUF6483 family protein [Chitinispirillaceae bacterium]|nr:DUF6483 family protein [Chitinispirillaceae bacterium]
MIVKIIEELSKVLAKILFLKSTGKVEEALNEIENYSSDALGIKLSLLETLSAENIFNLFGNNQLGNIKCLLAAKLFKEKALIISPPHSKQAQEIYHKALVLYLKSLLDVKINNESVLAQYYDDVSYIEKEIRHHLTEEEMYFLFKFYEKLERYEKAEDYLFFLKSRNYPSIMEEGKKFFQTVEGIDDSILNKCGLTKIEIREAYEEFMKK